MSFSLLVSIIASIIFFITFFIDHIIYTDLNLLYKKRNKYYITNNNKENFTPYINGVVRPHVRNIRRNVENFSNDSNSLLNRIIRKSGLYY